MDMDKMVIQRIAEQLAEIQTNQGIAQQQILFTDFMEEWFSSKEVQICTNTMDKYRSIYKNHVKPNFINRMLTDITTNELQKLVNEKSKIISTAMVRAMFLSIIRPALHDALGRDLIVKNPADFVKIPQLKEQHGHALTDEDITKLLKAAKGSNSFIALPLLLMTGLRRGEMLALTWSDVDFDNCEISVNKNYVMTNSHGCICKEPKTKTSYRNVAIPSQLVMLLKEHKVKQGGKTYVISQSKQDKMISPTNFARTFRTWCKKAGIHASTHDLRHTYCSVSLEADIPMKTIADQVGHRDTRMLEQVYLHNRTNKLQQNAAKKIGEKISTVLKVIA